MTQQNQTNPADNKWVYLLESDPAAVAKAARRWQTFFFAGLAFVVTAVCWRIWWITTPGAERPSLPLVIAAWTAGILLSLLAFLPRRSAKGPEALVGADFLGTSNPATGSGTEIVLFKDIVAVNLGLSKGRVVEVRIRAKSLTWVYIRAVKDPAILVRAIFEWGPAHVKWRRLRWPYTKLTRDEVRALIEKADLPPMDALLPHGAAYGQREEILPRPDTHGKSWLARLFARGSGGSFHAVSARPRPPGET